MGWYVGSLSAEQTDHHESTAPAHHPAEGHGESHGDAHSSAPAAPAAQALAEGAVSGAPWLCGVLTGSAFLFGAAVIIGAPTLKLKGDEAAEDDGHDDHDDPH